MCSIENCESAVHSKGLCQNHYRQEQRKSRGLRKPGPKPDPTKWRSRHNIDNPGRSDEPKVRALRTHCRNGHAYAEFGRTRADGIQVCKACQRERTEAYRNRTNPDRKRWLSLEERNAIKAEKQQRKEYSQTHCKRGHEFTEDNTYHYPNFRQCKQCSKLRGLRSAYGLEESDVESMLLDQRGTCAICEQGFIETPRVDHDHETGKVRGLLCHHCNTGLGQFKDNIEILQNAIAYLEKFSETTPAE